MCTYFWVGYLFIGLLYNNENQHSAVSFNTVMLIYANWKSDSPPPYVRTGTSVFCWSFFFSLECYVQERQWKQVGCMQLFQWAICAACREVLGCAGKQDTITLSSLRRLGSGSTVAQLSTSGSFAQPGSQLGHVLGQVNVCPQKDICPTMLWVPYISCASC